MCCWTRARGELPERAARALSIAPEASVCVATPWEVAIKAAGGKLRLSETPVHWFRGLAERYRPREIPLDAGLVCAALPFIHRDPFDRVLVALAQAQTLTVLTSDKSIRKYPGVTTLW